MTVTEFCALTTTEQVKHIFRETDLLRPPLGQREYELFYKRKSEIVGCIHLLQERVKNHASKD